MYYVQIIKEMKNIIVFLTIPYHLIFVFFIAIEILYKIYQKLPVQSTNTVSVRNFLLQNYSVTML